MAAAAGEGVTIGTIAGDAGCFPFRHQKRR